MKAKLADDNTFLLKGVENAILHFEVILETWEDYQKKRGTNTRVRDLDSNTMEKLDDALFRLRNLIDDAYKLREDLRQLAKQK